MSEEDKNKLPALPTKSISFASDLGNTVGDRQQEVRREYYWLLVNSGRTAAEQRPYLADYGVESLQAAAVCYLSQIGPNEAMPADWPLHPALWRPGTIEEKLPKAAALLLAAMIEKGQIDRLYNEKI